MTSLCFSSLLIKFFRHWLLGFIRFSYKHYDDFTIYHILNFRPSKFFIGELLAEKIQFSAFSVGKGYIFESRLYSELGNANFLKFCFFETDLTLTIACSVSYFWCSFWTKAVVSSVCLIFSCIGKVVIIRSRTYWRLKVFAGKILGITISSSTLFREQVLLARTLMA